MALRTDILNQLFHILDFPSHISIYMTHQFIFMNHKCNLCQELSNISPIFEDEKIVFELLKHVSSICLANIKINNIWDLIFYQMNFSLSFNYKLMLALILLRLIEKKKIQYATSIRLRNIGREIHIAKTYWTNTNGILFNYIKTDFSLTTGTNNSKQLFYFKSTYQKYLKKQLQIYTLCIGKLMKLYNKITHKRYKFGGKGYLLAKNNFKKLSLN